MQDCYNRNTLSGPVSYTHLDVYKRQTTDSGDIAIATDLGCVTDEAGDAMVGCCGVIIESNHDVEMLRRGPYPAELKRRIMSRQGHLSNDDCAYFAAILARSGTKRLLLAHLSRDNNKPELAIGCLLYTSRCV